MNKPKHTKGPWVYDGKSRDVVRNTSGTAICQLYKIHADSLIADAQLIAAAPELLEALIQAERVFNRKEIDEVQAIAMIDRILNTIAKAQGK